MAAASSSKRFGAISALLTGAFLLLVSTTFLIRQVHWASTVVFDEALRPTAAAAAVLLPSSQNTTTPLTATINASSIAEAVDGVLKSNSPTPMFPSLTENFNSARTTTNPLDRIKVPSPIFVASLPKSGTTSTARYFYCGDIWTAHTFVNTNGTTHAPRKQMRLGHCMLENIQKGNPPLQDCGNYKVWSDAGHPRGTPCFYPSVHGLQEFYDAYPAATILLVTRNSTAWSQSMLRWKRGELVHKWRRCKHFPGGDQVTEQDLTLFYEWHQEHLRNFTKYHPSLTYIEVSLEDETMGEQLEDKIGIPAECFGHHNSHEKRMRLNPKFRRQYLAQQQQQQQQEKSQ